MRVVKGWTEATLAERERVFEALIAKAVRMALRPITADLGRVLVAAGAPQLSTTSTALAPVVTMADTGIVTATWEGYVSKEIYPYLVETFLNSADAVLSGMESALDDSIPHIEVSYANDYLSAAKNRLVGIGDIVWTAIRTQLQLGVDEGEDTRQLASRVRSVAQVIENRAVVIARTEVRNAAEAGSLAQIQLGGFTDAECQKVWIATEDSRTRLRAWWACVAGLA